MKSSKKYTFFVVLFLILAFSALTAVGFTTYNGDIPTVRIKGLNDIRWGIDIRGGVDATFKADVPEGTEITEAQVNAAKSVIETRLMTKNITDYEVYPDYKSARIVVRFPWQVGDTSFDPTAAVAELGETALLTFREGAPDETTSDPESLPLILSGADVQEATGGYDSQDGQYLVQLVFRDTPAEGETLSGKEKFSQATQRLQGQPISIWLDDYCISAPTVNAQITDGNAVITGNSQDPFTSEEVNDLADKINGGALPYRLIRDNSSTISPTLGESAKDVMVLAGIIAFCAVVVFMVIIYRLPGVVAGIGLIGQVFGTLAILTGFFAVFDSFTLTIPGMAGIILSIGMGVDANVITSERIKEELRAGHSLDGALVSGYKRAFSAIFDGNITLIMIAFVLMGAFGTPGSIPETLLRPIFSWFGTSAAGSVYSFGFTLIIGAIFNFVFGVGSSRIMTYSISRFKVFRKPWLYGGYKTNKSDPKSGYAGKRKNAIKGKSKEIAANG